MQRGNQYTKEDIYQFLEVPEDRRYGAWNTGYIRYNGDFFIFSNVGVSGRTGHDYNNYWDSTTGQFCWEAKNGTHINQPLMQKMITPPTGQTIHLFTRESNYDPFTYQGRVVIASYEDTSPVRINWTLQ